MNHFDAGRNRRGQRRGRCAGDLAPLMINGVCPGADPHGEPKAIHRIGTAVESLGFDYLLTYDHVLGAVHGAESLNSQDHTLRAIRFTTRS